jgi:pimeloyl-ACP methyl ester carboxylesterase
MHVVDHLIPAPGGRLFARAWSNASSPSTVPIILLHDSLGCVDLWRRFPVLLAERTGRQVIAYDRLGFGRSDPHPGRLDASFVELEASTYLPCLVDGLGLRSVALFGHSVGGGMALSCAALHPQACTVVITEAAQTFAESVTLDGIRAAKREFAAPGQIARLERYHGDKARWVLEAWTETWLADDFAAWTLADVLPRIRCPALAIHGTQDEFGTTRHARMIAELTAGPARAEILRGGGHVPHREDPDRVLELVAGFLS